MKIMNKASYILFAICSILDGSEYAYVYYCECSEIFLNTFCTEQQLANTLKRLTHFMPLVSFNTPENMVKLMFSGGIERDQWHEMV